MADLNILQVEGGQKKVLRLILNTPKACRRSAARLLRRYNEGKIERVKYRDLLYGFGIFINLYKLEQNDDIERRLDDIVERMKQNNIW